MNSILLRGLNCLRFYTQLLLCALFMIDWFTIISRYRVTGRYLHFLSFSYKYLLVFAETGQRQGAGKTRTGDAATQRANRNVATGEEEKRGEFYFFFYLLFVRSLSLVLFIPYGSWVCSYCLSGSFFRPR
jgi:hypothetical protein